VTTFDQRGCGRSTPYLSLHKNTTWDLVADIEKLRTHLGLEKWLVFGGSWGSTLALAYGSKHAARMTGMILRGVCMMEPWEFEWLYSPVGAARMDPVGWGRFADGSGLSPRKTQSAKQMMLAYKRRFTSRSPRIRQRATQAWWDWEARLSWLESDKHPDTTPARKVAALSVIENHYFLHNAWIRPGQLLAAARRFRFPVTIVQGAYDLVCPPASAYAVHKAIPHSKLILTQAGHAASEVPTAKALRKATDGFTLQ
jgi:proline iminopeptidase